MLIYLAGPYSGTQDEIAKNVERAEQVSVLLWEAGHAVICPYLNAAHFETYSKQLTYEDYLRGNLNILARCDAILMLLGWEQSPGALQEYEYAKSLNIPIYYYGNDLAFVPDLHPTEVRCPDQVKGFREIVGQLYRIQLDKNADYSPNNILVTGEVGLVTRLWDKMSRMLNLVGFKFTISSAKLTLPTEARNETIDDTYQDMAVYSIIGLLLRRGVWGK